MPPLVIDLFCGCGGLSSGFHQAGFTVLAGLDKNAIALKTFQHNFPNAKAIDVDIASAEPGQLAKRLKVGRGSLDCLVGGPPCQGFSKNVPAANRFLDDPRNLLMKVFLNFVKELEPKAVVIENVAEILNAYDGAVRSEIVARLEKYGYAVESDSLNAARYGVPQLRRRAFFVASRTRKAVSLPSPTHFMKNGRNDTLFPLPVTVWQAISDLPGMEAGGGTDPCTYATEPSSDFQRTVRNGNKLVHDHVARKLTAIQLKRISHLGPGEGMNDLPDEIRPAKGYSGAYARLHVDEPARTITRWVFHPGSGRFIHPHDHRVITIREAARLQSFPDDFTFIGTYIQKSHQVGEAVPPLLARRIAEQVRSALAVG